MVRIKIFQFPIPAGEEVEEMNRFLGAHRISGITHHLVTAQGGASLVFVVQYAGAQKPDSPSKVPKEDVRHKMSEENAVIFDRLRDIRKEQADAEGVELFKIFSNNHLAAMVEKRITSLDGLFAIPGIRKTNVEKYGERFAAELKEQFDTDSFPKQANEESHEAGHEPF